MIITFTDQNGRPLEIEGKVNLKLLILELNRIKSIKSIIDTIL